jgi:uncharacterized membrane protein YeaQ/YmgE (transglycosylase-associated protein family)
MCTFEPARRGAGAAEWAIPWQCRWLEDCSYGSRVRWSNESRTEAVMHFLLFLLFGLIVGALARLIVPGREPGGWIVSMAIGVAGAVVGGMLGSVLGLYREGEPAGFVMSLLGAVLLVVAYQAVTRRRLRF